MASPILMQNDNLAKELTKQSVGRSGFNLSHSKTFPMYIGAIYPCCLIPTIPTESVEISTTALLKQLSPLSVPLMADLKLNIAYFWCDYRLGWKKFERFMQGGRSGNETYDLPKYYDYIQNDVGILGALGSSGDHGPTLHNSLRSYFGVTKSISNDLVEAMPFFAYQMICRDFYTNVDRLNESQGSNPSYFENDDDWSYNNLFPANPDDFRLSDGSQSNVNGVYLGKIRYHEFRPDYFLSSTYAPMRGDAPTLSLTSQSLQGEIPSGTHLTINPVTGRTSIVYDIPRAEQPVPTFNVQNIPLVYGNSRTLTGKTTPTDINPILLNTSDTSSIPSSANVGADLRYKGIDAQLGSSVNFNVTEVATLNVTAAQLTWLNQLTTWKELNILCKPYYRDFLNAHFKNVNIGEEQTERPIYIGGASQTISITEVTQVSQSTETSPLGTVGAKAGSLDSNRIGQFFCNDYGFIIGVAYIMPDMLYEPALPRWLSRETNLDFYSPEFANLSMQAILNKELFVSNDDDWNSSVLGYQGAFDELRSMPNQVAGDLLNNSYQDLQHYVLLRKFSNTNKPALTHTFLSMRDNIDYSAWALGDSVAPFIGQFANYINAVMPMPYVAVPKH